MNVYSHWFRQLYLKKLTLCAENEVKYPMRLFWKNGSLDPGIWYNLVQLNSSSYSPV